MSRTNYTAGLLLFIIAILFLGSFAQGLGGRGEATQVAFFTDNFTVSSDSGLYWNNVTKRLGIGTDNPLASLDIDSSNDSIPPIRIRAAPQTPIVANGSIEFDGDALTFTKQGARHSFALYEALRADEQVVNNTSAEVTILNYTLEQAELTNTKIINVYQYGSFDTATSSDDFTLRWYIGDNQIGESSPVLRNVNNAPYRSTLHFTIYNDTVGVNTTYAAYINVDLDRSNQDADPTTGTIDITKDNYIAATIQWNAAKPGNVFREQQEYVELIN